MQLTILNSTTQILFGSSGFLNYVALQYISGDGTIVLEGSIDGVNYQTVGLLPISGAEVGSSLTSAGISISTFVLPFMRVKLSVAGNSGVTFAVHMQTSST